MIEAEAGQARVEASLPGAAPPVAVPASRALDRFFFAPWRKGGLAPSTQKAYSFELMKLSTFLAPTPLADATEVKLREYLVSMHHRGVKAAAVRRATLAIRAYYAWLTLDGGCLTNPAQNLATSRAPTATSKALGYLEAKTLIRGTGDAVNREQLRDRAMLEIAYGAGLRVGELLGLKVMHVDGLENFVTIFESNGRSRTVPLPLSAAQALAAYLEHGRPNYLRAGDSNKVLFLTRLGRPVTPSGFWRHLKTLAIRAGLDPCQVCAEALRQASLLTKMLG